MAQRTAGTQGLRAVEREVRLTIPYWSSVAVLVNDPDEMPDLEERWSPKVVLRSEIAELTSAHAGARIERMRAGGVDFLLVPSAVYPWLDRHPEARRYLRTSFRQIPCDASVCLLYVLQPDYDWDGADAEDGLPLPPPDLIALVAGQLKPSDFYAAGRFGAIWIRELVERNGIDLRKLDSILDWGCGCGRVVRHWRQLTGASLFGCDYNPYLVHWCNENLPFGDFRVNELEPPLPFDDESFDLIYGLSVFTHLDEAQQLAWMADLRRVLRPGGALLLTFHGRARVEELRGTQWYDEVSPLFDSGELVVLAGELAGTNRCATYHPERYIREVLAGDLEVVHYAPSGALDIQQDAVLFRKLKPARRPKAAGP